MSKKINQEEYDKIVNELFPIIESWRIDLAKNIAINNPDLSIYNLNTVVPLFVILA